MEEGRSAFKIVIGKPTGNRLLGRPRRRWEDLEEIGVNAGNWVDSAQDRDFWKALVNASLNLRVPKVLELVNIALPKVYLKFTSLVRSITS